MAKDGTLFWESATRSPVMDERGEVALRSASTAADRGDAQRCEQLGFAAYLSKPIKQAVLRDALSAICGVEARPRGPDVPPPLVTRHTVAEHRTRSARILVAEDNPINQKIAVAMLAKLGYQVDVAVLMDCEMPEMDGFEASRRIRDAAAGARNSRARSWR